MSTEESALLVLFEVVQTVARGFTFHFCDYEMKYFLLNYKSFLAAFPQR